jgi:hypothetical protein
MFQNICERGERDTAQLQKKRATNNNISNLSACAVTCMYPHLLLIQLLYRGGISYRRHVDQLLYLYSCSNRYYY